jgi:hypothetical protein
VTDLDVAASGQQHRAIDHRAELAHVARPRVALEDGEHVRRQALAPGRGEEPQRERPDELRALPQRRDEQRDAVEPEEQVAPERLARDLGGQVAVRRGHEPHVDGDRPRRAEPQHLAPLDRAQELGLERDR